MVDNSQERTRNITRKEITWGDKNITLETGHMANQADGAVVVSMGGTMVLCTVVAQKKAKENLDFVPLSVHYQEKWFAGGKIPGGFFKREGKSTEREMLVSRLIDRPMRPLFPSNFAHETQIICTVLSYDAVHDSDILAMIGASAAVAISGLPFSGPLAAARVGYINNEYVLNPALHQMAESDLDLVVAGTAESLMMVESEAAELSEEIMLGALKFGHENMQTLLKAMNAFKDECGKASWNFVEAAEDKNLYAKIENQAESRLREAYQIRTKHARNDKISEIKQEVLEKLLEIEENVKESSIQIQFKKLEKTIVRGDLFSKNIRIDGRNNKEIRPISVDLTILPNAHGSAIFTRGETQALGVTTLGVGQDAQRLDSLDKNKEEYDTFMLHYNFPPYSVGETSPLQGPKRREVGHGNLAKKALKSVLPSNESFPYTIRVVSEILACNGSSSMASVCAGTLSLRDAGVPITASVAGIAMGLVVDGSKHVILSDIMGDEDHLGDMDLKVAGTSKGITALQMDIKINGINADIMQASLAQAREGLDHILGIMDEALPSHRDTVSKNAPSVAVITIPREKIREVIGSGGKVVQNITAVTGANVDIKDDGTINISGPNGDAVEHAHEMIKSIVADPKIGQIYSGRVVKVMTFGAFVNFLGPREGLVHVSEVSEGRVENLSDVVNEGDEVKVKVIGFDRGKVQLSMRAVDQKTGEDISYSLKEREPRAPRPMGDRPDRGDRPMGDRGDRPRGNFGSNRSEGDSRRSGSSTGGRSYGDAPTGNDFRAPRGGDDEFRGNRYENQGFRPRRSDDDSEDDGSGGGFRKPGGRNSDGGAPKNKRPRFF